jgi:hypothetical protein
VDGREQLRLAGSIYRNLLKDEHPCSYYLSDLLPEPPYLVVSHPESALVYQNTLKGSRLQ